MPDEILDEAEKAALRALPEPADMMEAVGFVAQAAKFLGWNIAVRFEPPESPDRVMTGIAIGNQGAIDYWTVRPPAAAPAPERPVQSLDSAATGVQKPAESEIRSGCPCTIIAPCSTACTCANGVMSGGCSRCARYGGPEQRTAAAERIAAALARAGSPQAEGYGYENETPMQTEVLDEKCGACGRTWRMDGAASNKRESRTARTLWHEKTQGHAFKTRIEPEPARSPQGDE